MKKNDLRILVVEDEEIIRMMFKQSFENWGFVVDEAENGKEAIDRCNNTLYNIIVTDINMPIMDGMEMLKRVKNKWPFIEVIVVTGFATIESAIEAMKLGAFDFILKPVNFEHVQFTINKCYQKIKWQAENSELRQVNAQLKELSELKDKFLHITNHEMRTPLTVIKGYLEVLESLVKPEDEDVREVFEILANTSDELYHLVDRMHMLESADRGDLKNDSSETSVDLKDLLAKVYKEVAGLYNKRKIELKIFVEKKPLLLQADIRKVRLVFRELIQNALKFTPDGGSVTVRLEKKEDKIIYSVKDSGVGVPFDKQELIFEKFYEVQNVINHRTSKQEFMGGGMGIGLNLVKEIVEKMSGQIMLESEPQKGSIFKIYLPAVSAAEKHVGVNMLQASGA